MFTNDFKSLYYKYKNLVSKVVSKYPKEHEEDLLQESLIALYKANECWDSSRAAFITLAYRYVKCACYRYMRDKANTVRLSRQAFESGDWSSCISLDSKIFDDTTLESLFGSESDEANIDISLTLRSGLFYLAERGIISWSDLCLLYHRYFYQNDYKTLSACFREDESALRQRVRRLVMKIRPHFLRRSRVL